MRALAVMKPEPERLDVLLFGRFSLDLHRRELLADGQPLPIGSRTLDVLIALIEGRGQLVTKDDLLSRVWPGTTVAENTLQFQVSALRKALGKDREVVKTVSGRAYRLVAALTTRADDDPASLAPAVATSSCPGRRRPITRRRRRN